MTTGRRNLLWNANKSASRNFQRNKPVDLFRIHLFQKEETDIYLNSKNLGIKTRWKNRQCIIEYLKFLELKQKTDCDDNHSILQKIVQEQNYISQSTH